jgi:hypothetical protein
MPWLRQNDRERAVGMVQAGTTHQAVADHFNVSRITISRLMIRLRQTGRMNDVYFGLCLSWYRIIQKVRRPNIGQLFTYSSDPLWTKSDLWTTSDWSDYYNSFLAYFNSQIYILTVTVAFCTHGQFTVYALSNTY